MSKNKKVFEADTDYKNIILNNTDTTLMIDCDILKDGLKVINKADEMLNKKILEFSHYIDLKLRSSTDNRFRKIPNIIMGSFLINKYDLDLSLEEMSILTNHILDRSYDNIDFVVNYYNKDLLDVVSSKTTDYHYQEELMNLVDLREDSDILNYIRTGNLEELVVESHKLQRDVADNFRL